jgi:hypothetical protein
MKINNIMFSGGFDSTALLLSKLSDNINIQNSYDKVRYNVISVYHENIPNKEEDKNARDSIKCILNKQFPEEMNRFSFREIKMSDGGIAGQASMWPAFALTDSNQANGDDINLWFGYVKGDDFWHSKGYYENLYAAYEKIIGDYTGNKSKIITNFPFEWFYKNELVYLYSTVPSVFDAISWAGDDGEAKLKEKQEIKNIFDQISRAKLFFREPKKMEECPIAKSECERTVNVQCPINHVEVKYNVAVDPDEKRGQYV